MNITFQEVIKQMNISSRLEGLEPSTFGFGDQRSTN